jgi:hypothetical protein
MELHLVISRLYERWSPPFSLSAGVGQVFFLIAVSTESTGAACFCFLLWGLLLLRSSFTGPKVYWVRYVDWDERERKRERDAVRQSDQSYYFGLVVRFARRNVYFIC